MSWWCKFTLVKKYTIHEQMMLQKSTQGNFLAFTVSGYKTNTN